MNEKERGGGEGGLYAADGVQRSQINPKSQYNWKSKITT